MAERRVSLKRTIFRLYDRTIDSVMVGLVFIMLVLMLLAFLDVLLDIRTMLLDAFGHRGGEVEFRTLVGDVLDVFVVVELFNTFMTYVRTRRVRMSTLLDLTIVFALREMLIKLYDRDVSVATLMTLSGVILTLVVCRTLTSRFSPQRQIDGA